MWGRSGQKCPVGAKFPPFGGASIASGYTPDALAGAKPQHPPAPKGEKGVKAQGRNRNQLTTLANMGRIQILRSDELIDGYADLCQKLLRISREVQ